MRAIHAESTSSASSTRASSVLGSASTPIDVRSTGTRNVIDAMHRCGVRRLVVQTSYGVGATRWEVTRTRGGHLKFVKPGMPPIYTSSTTSDQRSVLNARARISRAAPVPEAGESDDD